jgi:hypothetical protein
VPRRQYAPVYSEHVKAHAVGLVGAAKGRYHP